MKKASIRSNKNHRTPHGFGDGREGACDRTPINIGIFPPRGSVISFGGVFAAAARDGEDITLRQGDRSRIPTRVIHVRHPCPGIGLPIEDTGKPDNIPPAHHLELPIRPQHSTAAEHVVLVPIHLRHRAGAGIPNGGIREFRTIRERGALVGGICQDPSVRQIGRSHRHVRQAQRGIPLSGILRLGRVHRFRHPLEGRQQGCRRREKRIVLGMGLIRAGGVCGKG